jgi:hypothetical protein
LIIAVRYAEGGRVDEAGAIISAMDDWRLTPANEKRLRAAVFVRKPFPNDHDHCQFCWAEFVQPGTPVHTEPTFYEGFTTSGPLSDPTDDYYWVCPTCFEDFRKRLEWTVRPATGDRDSI